MADDDKPQGLQGLGVALEAAAEHDGVTVASFLGVGHYRPSAPYSTALHRRAFSPRNINRATAMRVEVGPDGRKTVVIGMTTAQVFGEELEVDQ